MMRPMSPADEVVRALVDELASTRDPRALWPRLAELVARNQPAVLLQLARATQAEPERFQANTWVLESTLDEIERVLALTPGMANADTLAKILRTPRAKSAGKDESARIRFAAS